MTLSVGAALVYLIAAAPPILCQVGLVFGAPWGHLTLSGRWPGTLPLSARPAAVLQASILAIMCATMLAKAGILSFPLDAALFWPVVVLNAISLGLHLISPSKIERQVWTPFILVMLVCALILGFV